MFPNFAKEDLKSMGIDEDEIPAILSYIRIRSIAIFGCGMAVGMMVCLWFISVVIIFG